MIEHKFTPTHTKLNKMRNAALTTSSNKSNFLYLILFQLTFISSSHIFLIVLISVLVNG